MNTEMPRPRRGRPPKSPVVMDDDDDDLRQGASVHGSREKEFPSDEPVHDEDFDDWRPPALLEAPPARPGYVQRWVRVQQRNGQPDAKNWSRARMEGWAPRDPATVPKDIRPPTDAHGTFANCIMVEGMILCEMPERKHRQRQAYYARLNATQMEAVEQDLMRVQQHGHPILKEHRSEVTRGSGRRPQVQDDDDA